MWAFLRICLQLRGLIKTFFTKLDPQNAHKMPNCKYHLLCNKKGVLFYNERHPLLMKCFKAFLLCMRQVGGAYLCIFLSLKGLTELYSTKVDYQVAGKIPDVWYALSVPTWLVGLK